MNLVKSLGLTPELLAQISRVGGIVASRQLIKDHFRSVSKILHPDKVGSSSPYYISFLKVCSEIDAMTDQELLDMIKSKESKATDTKPQPIYRSYFAEFIDASKNHHTVIPTGADLRIVSLVTTDKALSRGSKDNTPVYSIKPTETGIAYRKDSEDDWQSERGIYFFGSMPRAVDTEIKNAIYPDSSKWHHDLRIAGKSNRAGLILRLPFSKALISLVQKNYTKHLVPGNIMLTIDHNAQIYHFGYIAVAEQAD